jgi:hypothetical protein
MSEEGLPRPVLTKPGARAPEAEDESPPDQPAGVIKAHVLPEDIKPEVDRVKGRIEVTGTPFDRSFSEMIREVWNARLSQ